MGFGILFIGYFVAFVGSFLGELTVFTYILGAGIIILGLRNLVFENKMFVASAVLAVILEISALTLAVMGFCGLDQYSLIYTIFNHIFRWSSFALNIALMAAIAIISHEVELPKIKVMSIINSVFIIFGLVVNIAYELNNNEFDRERLTYVSLGAQIAYVVFGLIIVFNCYVRICYEDDKNMEKKSGIPFFDFLNDKLENAFNKNKLDKGGKKGGKK